MSFLSCLFPADLAVAFAAVPVAGRSATMLEVTTRAAAAVVIAVVVFPRVRMPVAELGSISSAANGASLSRELSRFSGN